MWTRSIFYIITGFFLIGLLAFLCTTSISAQSSLPAFPGAEGFGANTIGGRGGTVYIVSNLNDSGPGSLRACAIASGPRICVFRVAGTITINSNIDITNPFITIAGQTAPGGGITLKASDENSTTHLRVRTHDVIIRYIRSRPGTRQYDGRALSIGNGNTTTNPAHSVVIDHVSLSWAGDEILTAWYHTNNVTIQWTVMAESLPAMVGGVLETGLKGPNLGGNSSDENGGGGPYSLHHNLIAHHTQRFPKMNQSAGPVDLVNNIMYNMGGNSAGVVQWNAKVNFVNNYIKSGPNTFTTTFVNDQVTGGGYYLSGNYVAPGRITQFAPTNGVATRYTAPSVSTVPANPQAYEDVLTKAGAVHGLTCEGAWFNRPDSVDTRIIQSVRDGTRGHTVNPAQTVNQLGYINSPSDVAGPGTDANGWPILAAGTPCPDSDNDGMPDAWENATFGNLTKTAVGTDLHATYTNIEMYINGPVDNPSLTPTNTVSPSPTPIPGDVNDDGHVTLVDLSTLLSNFGKTGTRSQGNVVGTDNAINLLDLSTLLANFGR